MPAYREPTKDEMRLQLTETTKLVSLIAGTLFASQSVFDSKQAVKLAFDIVNDAIRLEDDQLDELVQKEIRRRRGF